MKMLRLAHKWAGVFLSLVLLLIGVTGAVSAFRGELMSLTVPGANAAAPDPQTYGSALAEFEEQTGARIQFVKFSPYGIGVHRVYLEGGENAYVDETGQAVERWRGRRLEDAVLTLHEAFLLGEPGAKLSGLIGIATALSVLAGVLLWLPAARSFRLTLAPKSTARRDLHAFHRNWGIVLAAPILFMSVTGAAMHFEGELRGILASEREIAVVGDAPRDPMDWPRVLASAQAVFPHATVKRVSVDNGGLYHVHMRARGEINTDGSSEVLVEGLSGRVVGSHDSRTQGDAGPVFDVLLALHGGGFAGLFGRGLVAIVGIGLSVLGLVGVGSFLRARVSLRGAAAKQPA